MSGETGSLEDNGGGDVQTPGTAAVAAEPSPGARSVGPGDCVSRYHVRERIGSGGMGEVFAAHDPELNRIVALKLLKPELAGASPEARARFQREAQAMARLNHPNVVSVFDVSTVGDRVFVAMELVDGPTLARWLASAPRTWREVVAVMLQAGRGLEAAPDAGIVHRDFKPSNVIVGDRVRVADFGLARARHDAEVVGGAAEMPLDVTITRTGAQVGTAAYMAPEQRAGEPVTAASDQYAFAITLHEALFGARPGAPMTTARGVPRWLRAVVERGLRERPEERYPSMGLLLADLARDPTRIRRRWLVGAGMLGVAALVAADLVAPGEHRPAPCAGAEARLARVWDGARKDAVATAFAATGLPYAEDSWRRVRARVDDYASRWVDMHTDTCRATRVDGRQSESLMDLRMSCLERRRAVLGALTGAWARGVDASSLRAAIDASQRLDPVEECADTRALAEGTPLPSDAGRAALVRSVQAHLDDVRALHLAHRWPEALAAASATRIEADPPVGRTSRPRRPSCKARSPATSTTAARRRFSSRRLGSPPPRTTIVSPPGRRFNFSATSSMIRNTPRRCCSSPESRTAPWRASAMTPDYRAGSCRTAARHS